MMKKNLLILIALLSILSAFLFFKINKKTMIDEENLAVYVNNQLVSTIPKKGEAMYIKSVCDTDAKASWNNDSWSLLINNLNQKTKCNLYFYSGQTVFDFDYTGGEQNFIAPVSGTYRLEIWGAQGGNAIINGNELENIFYGGYSNGQIYLKKDNQIFISVGGIGNIGVIGNQSLGGWNGGGNGDWDHSDDDACGGGGGATSIQDILIDDGQLKNYENNKSAVLMVAGGSSGMGASPSTISSVIKDGMYLSSGGGYLGGAGVKIKDKVEYIVGDNSNQTSGYAFGQGGSALTLDRSFNQEIPGGGGGYYGGSSLTSDDISNGYSWSTSGGGSGYIGNPLLTNKVMYCYNCKESNEESTKTISTTCSEETPTSNCAKKGNGYARITLISVND